MKCIDRIRLVSIFATLLLAGANAWTASIGEGQEKGNGSENGSVPVGAVSWFSGSRTVKYCLSVANDFPVDRGTLEKKTAAAITQWVELIKNTERHYYTVLGPYKHLALNYSQLPSCNGTEDLKFYFGEINDEIEKAKQKYNKPLAIAEQTYLDKSQAWSRGFIWLAPHASLPSDDFGAPKIFPDWTKDHQLYAILLHEIGHVFGCNHMSGTIMRHNIAWFLSFTPWGRLGTDYFYHINQQRLLFAPVSDEYIFPGKLGFQSYETKEKTKAEDVFKLLMGKNQVGESTAKLRYRDDYLGNSIAELTVNDESGQSKKFPIRLNQMGHEARIQDSSNTGGFQIAFVSSNDGKYYASSGSNDYGKTITGSLKTASGKSLALLIQVNMLNTSLSSNNNGPVTIGYLDSKQNLWKTLYQTNLIYSKY